MSNGLWAGLDLAGLDLDGRRVLVLGLGVSGVEVAKVLASRGGQIIASDSGVVDPAVRATLEAAGVEVESEGHDRAAAELSRFRAGDFVFPSPGISPLRGFLKQVCASGVPVVSELELGVHLSDVPVIAVTGTNGKTTVCRLAERIGREAGLDVHACGNLETKYLTAAADHPDADVFVVEASSFSLAFCHTFHPRVAVVTSLAPDHLDWHGTFEHYRDSKARIASHQLEGELYLYPRTQPELEGFAPRTGPLRAPFGATGADGFGNQVVELGAWTDGSAVEVRLPGTELRAAGVGKLAARGRHFAADAAAAAAAMSVFGADEAAMERAFEGFRFDAHRLEPVGARDGVRVYDDSTATNTHAALAAIDAFKEPIVLIAGGRNKGIDLSPLASVAGRLRAVVAIGEAAEEIQRVFAASGVFVPIAASMREAVAMALDEAKDGDVILLAPACASHDMFLNYADRGDQFQAACREAGVVP